MGDELGSRHTLGRLCYYDPREPGTIHIFHRKKARGAIAGWLAFWWEFLLGR